MKLCDPANLSVLIPYKDLEKLMEYAKGYQKIEQDFQKLEKRVLGLHGVYVDVLEQLHKVYDLL